MEFKKCSIGGIEYGRGYCEVELKPCLCLWVSRARTLFLSLRRELTRTPAP